MGTTLYDETKVAATWLMAARAMFLAGERSAEIDDASAGLYAQAILGVSEASCLKAKSAESSSVKTLIDCLASLATLPRDLQEKIVTGVMMIAFSDRKLQPLEVRWASMLASSAKLSNDDFQRCCASARVFSSMLGRREEDAAS